MDGETKYRLKGFSIAVLLVAAIFADLLTIIPLVGDFVGPVYWVCVSIFLYFKGFGILNARRFATSAISMVAEMIPAIQAFPLIIAGTIAVIIFSRIEDKTGLKARLPDGQQPLNISGVRLPQTDSGNTSQPLNANGVRQPGRE